VDGERDCDNANVIMIWATKRVYKTGRGGQGPGWSAGHWDEGRDEEKGLTTGGTSQSHGGIPRKKRTLRRSGRKCVGFFFNILFAVVARGSVGFFDLFFLIRA
jgi:hypothetical protein